MPRPGPLSRALGCLILSARGDAPKIVLFRRRLSGAFCMWGGHALFDRLVAMKFPTPIADGSLSYLAARQRWADWWMRIFLRNILNVVAKSIASGIRIFNTLASPQQPCQWTTPPKQPTPCLSPGTHTDRTQTAQTRSPRRNRKARETSNLIVSPLDDDDTEVQFSNKKKTWEPKMKNKKPWENHYIGNWYLLSLMDKVKQHKKLGYLRMLHFSVNHFCFF